MEIPFYTSFKEFKDNYETDLEKWLSIYPDGDEMDYLKLVEDYYNKTLKSKFIYFKYEDYWIARDKERTGEGVTIDDLLDILYNEYSGNDFAEYMKEKINSTDETYKTYLEEVYIEPFKPFIDNNDFLGLYFNDTKFENFQYAKGKISKFIRNRRKEISETETLHRLPSTIKDQPTTQEDGKEHEKQKARVKLNKTQKINILIELGIYQYIYNKGYHGRQVEFLFADILDTTDRYVREVGTSSGKINQEFAKDYLEKLKNMKTKDLEKKSKNQ
ncbi:hypothetical protein [Riemerella anatipestifer]|uniref:hypothetical protein n=1 Tax=Riemerella anatipestifer TaxID=34085 RepID=UPI001C6EF427|nr:hypothetical protein [Riemerella anatipestifer]QYQ97840.1 hypothetical protein J6342_01035 [Riemerella anatipestifer]